MGGPLSMTSTPPADLSSAAGKGESQPERAPAPSQPSAAAPPSASSSASQPASSSADGSKPVPLAAADQQQMTADSGDSTRQALNNIKGLWLILANVIRKVEVHDFDIVL